ncbi:high frequency lysogenization protein HflD [Oceanicoccus sp. KOV_DT_Chl]|uniref:high frequency lysogenization protein HflD n=1 Tax=Oceanicoccus sp. KOV_DT_Chl TaxID=1904639 RepID=UPI000C7988F4|nr:high frequency lysogenization protein HflD [Oceanicoccus sp. KOV_DT_Chl]
MNNSATISQTIALAGVLQSAYLVDQIARTGNAAAESFNPSINSLFQFDPDNAADVYSGVHGVKLGLQLLSDILGGNSRNEYRTVVRYTMGMLYLEKKLSAKSELLQIIRSRLEHTALKAEHFSDNINSTTANIAAIYQDTLSTFKFRIQISGSAQQLQNTTNANNIRALLLAGIRGSVLWRQSGGKRWHLILSRQRLITTARELLDSL